EDQLLDLGLRDALVDEAGPRFEQDGVADPQPGVLQRRSDPDDALVIGVADDQGPFAVGEQLLDHDDLADPLVFQGAYDVERFVEHDLLAWAQLVGLDVGADGDAQLPPAGEHVDRAVVVFDQEGSEPGRRLSEAVDLLFERHDLVAGLAKCGGQPLVLRVDRRQARLEEGHLTSHVGRLTARASAPVFEAIVVRSHLAPPRKGVVYSQTLQSQASFATHVINDWPEGDFRRGTNVSNRPRRSGPPAPGVAV